VNATALAEAYASAKPHYERRVASLKKLAEHALKGTAWYEPIAFDDREDQVERNAQMALRLFGLDEVGYGLVRDIFFPLQKIDPKHASTWRSKQKPAPRQPTESELEFVTRGNPIFGELPKDWACPGCKRPKRDVVRWSQNSKRFMFVVHARSIPDPSARYGMRKITLCDSCDYTFRECHKELRVLLGDQFLLRLPCEPRSDQCDYSAQTARASRGGY
jgi:rubredoxin